VEDLHKAWNNGKEGDKNPHHRFHNACTRLQAKYMDLQRVPKDQHEEITLLKAKLQVLKQEIVDTYFGEQVDDLVNTEEQVRALEDIDIAHHKRLSRLHWLGEGNEPSKFYFATLKEKMQQESMPLLLTDDSHSITGETNSNRSHSKLYNTICRAHTNRRRRSSTAESEEVPASQHHFQALSG
jgi:hypothetical protein